MKTAFASALFLLSGAASLLGAAETLVVLNKSDHEAALVHPTRLKVLAKLPTGKGPHEAAVSPDGKFVYVTDYGSYSIFRNGQREQMPPGSTVTVLDLAARKVAATWSLGEFRGPHGIAVSRDGKRLWVTVENSRAVLELDTAVGKILKSWKTDQDVSHMLVPTPDETKLYVANIGSGSVTVIRRADDAVTSIPTGAGAEGIDVSPDGREVWVTNRGANTISVIAVATDEVAHSFDSGGLMPIRVKFTPDGKRAWVSNARSNSVAIFDTGSRQRLALVEVGAVPVGILLTPDGKRGFVANTNDDKVTIIDGQTFAVLRSFRTGNEPDGMAWID